MRYKNQKQYGSFATKRAWYTNPKLLTAVGIGSGVLISLLVFGYYALKGENKAAVTAVIDIPTATASEMPGWWYQEYFGKDVCEEERCKLMADPDNDKLSNMQEFYYRSNPLNKDTNKNGLTDGEDVSFNYDPSKPGKVSFDEAASDDSIFGESLLFGEDVKKIVNEMVDPNRVELPEVDDTGLAVTDSNTKDDLIQYFVMTQVAADKYFQGEIEQSIDEAIRFGKKDEVKLKSIMLLSDLKKITVPSHALQLHKYYIAMVQLIPLVLEVPELTGEFAGSASKQEDIWFSNTQGYLVLTQKAHLEKIKLINLINADSKRD